MTSPRIDPRSHETLGDVRKRCWSMINIVQASVPGASLTIIGRSFIDSLNYVDLCVAAEYGTNPNNVADDAPIPEPVYAMLEAIEDTYQEIVLRYSN